MSPWLNLAKLLTPASWSWTLASFVMVVICFYFISFVGKRRMGVKVSYHFPYNAAPFIVGQASLSSFHLLWLVWAVCGGLFITNFILCNYLKVLVKPVFERPIDTAQVIFVDNTENQFS